MCAGIGVSVLLRNWTLGDNGDTTFATAAEEQLDYLLNVAPRAPNGAISQRESQVQLWADFVYMAPPFIAYYGALEGEYDCQTLLQTAYDQVRLYREVLYDADVGLWRHIALGDGTDPTHWATGNAWAAAGMLRVLATIQQSSVASQMTSQRCDLEQWVGEILDAAWSFQVSVFFSNNTTILSHRVRLHRTASERHSLELYRPARLVRRLGLDSTDGRIDVPLCEHHEQQQQHTRGDPCAAACPGQSRRSRVVAQHG